MGYRMRFFGAGELYPDESRLPAGSSAGIGRVYGKLHAVRPIRPRHKLFIPLFVVAVAGFATWNSQRNDGRMPAEPAMAAEPAPARPREVDVGFITEPGRPKAFDFYLLAMTSHPAFCRDGHARKPECRAGRPIPLSIHGLWPEVRETGRYPRDCRGPALQLEPGLERELAQLMPGMSDGLHEHEWRKHGTCSGLGDDAYFELTLRLAREVNAALGERLTSLAGQSTNAAELRAHADRLSPGIGATLTFHCRNLRDAPAGSREAYLVEVRQCVTNGDEGRARAVRCAQYNRRDQGCGRAFRIAG